MAKLLCLTWKRWSPTARSPSCTNMPPASACTRCWAFSHRKMSIIALTLPDAHILYLAIWREISQEFFYSDLMQPFELCCLRKTSGHDCACRRPKSSAFTASTSWMESQSSTRSLYICTHTHARTHKRVRALLATRATRYQSFCEIHCHDVALSMEWSGEQLAVVSDANATMTLRKWFGSC